MKLHFMAPSQVSVLKMKNFVVGAVLAFLTNVQSTHVNTEILTKDESDFFYEAMKDEFLIFSPTTQSPEKNTTVLVSSHSKENGMIAAGDNINHDATTTQSVSHTQSSTSTVMTRNTDTSTTQRPSSAEKAKMQTVFLDHLHGILRSDLGSGDGEVVDQHLAISSSMTSNLRTEDDAVSLTSTAPSKFTGSDKSDLGSKISEEFSEPTVAEKELMQKMYLGHSHSVLISDLGSGDGEMEGSRLGLGISEELSEPTTTEMAKMQKMFLNHSSSTLTPDLGSGDGEMVGLVLGLGKSEELSESNTTEMAKMQKMFLNHLPSTLASDLGSGDGGVLEQSPTTTSSMTSRPRIEASTALSTATAPPGGEGSDSSSGISEKLSVIDLNKQFIPFTNGDSSLGKGHSTPGWIVILACVVGVAALAIVCIAFATREKWIGPNQIAHLEINANSSNQQEELEMETFLHKDKPRENGKAGEYTIIPLDELPQGYPSH